MPTTPPDRLSRRFARSPRAIPLSAAIASTALLVAGCGGASGAGSPSAANGAIPKSIIASAFKYSSCMRGHGVPSFPDPKVVNLPGQHGVLLHLSASASAAPQFQTARKACQGLMPAPGPNQSVGESPQQLAAHLKGILGFARCMRGTVPSFPDPTGQGQLSLAMVKAAGIDLHAPAVQAAARSCVPASDGQITAADVARALNSAG